MKMKKILIIIAFLLSATSCSNKNNQEPSTPGTKIIPEQEMSRIFIDILITEGAITSKQLENCDVRYYTFRYYNNLLKKNNINHIDLNNSLDYYAVHTDKMLKIMSEVVDSLSLLQSQINNE